MSADQHCLPLIISRTSGSCTPVQCGVHYHVKAPTYNHMQELKFCQYIKKGCEEGGRGVIGNVNASNSKLPIMYDPFDYKKATFFIFVQLMNFQWEGSVQKYDSTPTLRGMKGVKRLWECSVEEFGVGRFREVCLLNR